MTSKDTERKALEKIEKIVKELGEDSYIATAFEGCFEIARTNIENDFACSMQDRVESAERKVNELQADLDHLAAVKNFLADKVDAYEAQVKELKYKLESKTAEAEEIEDALKCKLGDANSKLFDAENKIADLQSENEAKDLEIMKLKAKLFDLMMATK